MPSHPQPVATVDSTHASSFQSLDRAIASLQKGSARWEQTDNKQRIDLLLMLEERLLDLAPTLVKASDTAKKLTAEHPCAGEDWQTTVWVSVRNMALLRLSLEKGEDALPKAPHIRSSGQVVQPVFPRTSWDRLLFMGYRAEVWHDPTQTAETIAKERLLKTPRAAQLCLVLGAGNVGSIPIMDSLYKLFVENQVVLLKMNPVNAYLGPLLLSVFKPLVDLGVFAVVYGGAPVGRYLCEHPSLPHLHLTGSDRTHDAILWGPPDTLAEQKASGHQRVNKTLSSELGNITPIIIVPGEWSARELRFQAWNIASMVTNNASFNCIAGKMLITSKEWPQRTELLELITECFAQIIPRYAYYPGAVDRHQDFVQAHPDARLIGTHGLDEGHLPWTLITDLDPTSADDICFTTEPFCSVLSETPLRCDGTVDFLPKAVAFANNTLWGNLSCSIILSPASQKEPGVQAALDESIEELRYGAVSVNHWAGIPYGLCALPWGAFPGNPNTNIQSGRGVVHNALRLNHTQKSVLYGPFTAFPRPPWFVNHQRAALVGQRMAEFDHQPGFLAFARVLLAAIRG